MTSSASSTSFPSGDPGGGRPHHLVAFQRASDLDRDQVCDQLGMHYSAGRLRPDELDARLYAAVRAETLIELRRLVSDLPPDPQPQPGVTPRVPDVPQPALPPTPGPTGWSGLDVLALLITIGTLGLAFIALFGLGLVGQGDLIAAGLVCGTVAALGGASAAHLLHKAAARGRGR